MTIWRILDWILYGLIRYVLSFISWIPTPTVDRGPPSEWYKYASYYQWYWHDDDNGRPTTAWCEQWLEMAFGELAAYATEKARPYVDQARAYLLGVIGYIRSGYSSLGSWVNYLQNRIGEGTLSFASNLRNAASWLYFKLPYGVRAGWQSWDQIWDGIKSTVWGWVLARYDAARAWAWDAVNWVNSTGDQLRHWRDRVAGWIDQVRGDSYGWIVGRLGWAWSWLAGFASNGRDTVLGWLGPEWPGLVTFGRDCVAFYYNLWSKGWSSLGEFVDDPKSFVLDRLEQAVLERW